MEDWSEIRRRVLVEGVSKRQILRETKLHWLTLKKILAHSEPPGYRQKQPRPQKKLAGFFASAGQICWNRFTGPGKIALQTMYCHMEGGE